MRFRFSTRSLLLLAAVVAVFCWRRDRPRQLTIEFAAALRARDWPRISQTFAPAHQDGLFAAKPYGLLDDSEFDVDAKPQSAGQWLCGEKELVVTHRDAAMMVHTVLHITARAEGLAYGKFVAKDVRRQRSLSRR